MITIVQSFKGVCGAVINPALGTGIWFAHAIFSPDEAGDYCVICLLIAYFGAEIIAAALAG